MTGFASGSTELWCSSRFPSMPYLSLMAEYTCPSSCVIMSVLESSLLTRLDKELIVPTVFLAGVIWCLEVGRPMPPACVVLDSHAI